MYFYSFFIYVIQFFFSNKYYFLFTKLKTLHYHAWSINALIREKFAHAYTISKFVLTKTYWEWNMEDRSFSYVFQLILTNLKFVSTSHTESDTPTKYYLGQNSHIHWISRTKIWRSTRYDNIWEVTQSYFLH